MEEIINKTIIDHLGVAIFIMVAILVGIIAMTWWCANIYIKIKKVDSLPCEKHSEKMSLHDNAVSKSDTSISFLTKEIETAMRMMQQKDNKGEGFTQAQSPLSITTKGKDMIKHLSLDKMFDRNWPRIKELIESEVPEKNAYDIDNFCIQQAVVFPEKFLAAEEISILKDDAFKNGITLTPYMKVVAVMSRDRYFSEHDMNLPLEDKNG